MSRKWIPLSGILEMRPNLRMILANTGWLLFDRIFRMCVGLVVGVWIARYLGPHQFGLLNYAISIAAILGAISPLGLDIIVVREIVKTPENKENLLGTGIALRLLSGGAVFLLCLIVALLERGEPVARVMIVIIAAGYLFQAFDTVDCWFQANVQSRYSVIARNLAFFLISVAKIVCLLLSAPLVVFAVLATGELVLVAVGMLVAYKIRGHSVRRWKFDAVKVRTLLKDGWPLALSGLTVAIYMRVDQVLLGNMLDAQAVGIYSAAVKLVEVWYFIPGAITVSVFPSLVRMRSESNELFLKKFQQFLDLMSGIALSIAVLGSLFASNLIGLIYGDAYAAAAPVLAVYAWSAVGTILGIGSSQFLMAENLMKISLYRTLTGMITNLVLNVLLIPFFGLIGSAVAALVTQMVTAFSVGWFPQSRRLFFMMIKSLVVVRAFVSNSRAGNR